MAEIKKLSKETLNKCFWTWEWTYQACYNYENMQGGCFLDAMAPAIRELYPAGSDEFKDAASRHFEFYNIENTTGGGVLGLVLAMEEQIASGDDVTPDAVRSIKTGLMGPLSGIGDFLNRDHATVLSSIRKIEGQIKTDKEMAATIRDITSNINSRQ